MRFVLLLFTIGLIGLPAAQACVACEGDGPVCEAFWKRDVAFLATVVEITPEHIEFSVTEVFRGAIADRVRMRRLRSSCDFVFAAGKQYLVITDFAAPGLLRNPSSCSATALADESGHALAFLRQLPSSPALARIFGLVRHDSDVDIRAVKLRVVGESTDIERSLVRSDAFDFPGLPPGKYRLWLDSPQQFFPEPVSEVDVPAHGCSEVELRAMIGGGLRGRVIDHRGLPVKDVGIRIVKRLPDGSIEPVQGAGGTGESGSFSAGPVDAGEYLVCADTRRERWHDEKLHCVFAPGVTNSIDAQVVEIRNGEFSEVAVVLPPGN